MLTNPINSEIPSHKEVVCEYLITYGDRGLVNDWQAGDEVEVEERGRH
jgi:hypothetical protein